MRRSRFAGAGGSRVLPFERLHRLPGDTPQIETALLPGELIIGVRLPVGPWTRRSLCLKIRDRQSYEFALASAAVAIDLDRGAVNSARIAPGGVATTPWRAHDAENALKGRALDESSARQAADVAFAAAEAAGITLIAVAWHDGFETFIHPHRLVDADLAPSVAGD